MSPFHLGWREHGCCKIWCSIACLALQWFLPTFGPEVFERLLQELREECGVLGERSHGMKTKTSSKMSPFQGRSNKKVLIESVFEFESLSLRLHGWYRLILVVIRRLGEDVAQLRAQLAQGVGEARHWNHSTIFHTQGYCWNLTHVSTCLTSS